MAKLKVVSLFAGCGGADLGIIGGFEFLGNTYSKNNAEIVLANEIDPLISSIYAKNFDHNLKVVDIRNLKNEEIPNHDVLVGGFPCQSFSIIAQNPPRLGFNSENGKLVLEMIRILKLKKPRAFIAENVKGLISANGGKTFPLILDEFQKAGYKVSYSVVNASEYGVPQNRLRVFIIGIRKDLAKEFHFPPTSKLPRTVLRDVVENNGLISKKYYFSEKAVSGMLRSREKMNKGRDQNLSEPCATVTSHLSKVSLNSTDPVLLVDNKYRRFIPREVARIQSFPESYELVGSESTQYKALGNAIPPVVMWHVFRKLIKTLLK